MRAWLSTALAALALPLAAENVWTLGEYDRRTGWELRSPDCKVSVYLEGDVRADLEKGVARLKGARKSLVSGSGSIDLAQLAVKTDERVYPVRSLRIGDGFLQDNETVVSFRADNVDEIGAMAFCRAKGLEKVDISGSADALPDGKWALHPTLRRGVFSGCGRLSDLTLSLPIVHIGSAAFAGCTNLSADVGALFPHGVKKVGASAFLQCAGLKGKFETSAAEFVGMCAFAGCGIEDIRLGCADTLVNFAGGEASGRSGHGIFSPMPSITNLEIRAPSLVTVGASSLGHSPKLKRILIAAPELRSLGESRDSCRGLTALEVLDLETPKLDNVGSGWPPFHDARRLREVVWRTKPPPFAVLKRVFNGVECVLNSAKEGKKCIIRVPADDKEWDDLISPLELDERDYAPPSCAGVVFASSRKAWVMRDAPQGRRSSAAPETWFHVIGGNASKEGLVADIEAIAEAGISGIQFFHGGWNGDEPWPGVTNQIPCLGEQWVDLVKTAEEECHRRGLSFKMQNCPGWSMSGGPWITPERAMRKLVAFEPGKKPEFDADDDYRESGLIGPVAVLFDKYAKKQ